MTSRVDFRKYRSSAQMPMINIHRRTYNHVPVHGLTLKYREVFQLGLLDSTDIYTIEEDSDYQTEQV